MPDDIYYDEPQTISEQPATEMPGDDAAASFDRRIVNVQRRLKAPKSQYNSYGGYYYRNCEDILEGLKPLLDENDLLMTIDDEVIFIEGRFYIKSTVTVRDIRTGLSRVSHAFAREPENRKGSDQSQVTGSCSSYARKFALNALWLIDDTKDADTPQGGQKAKEPPAQGQFLARCTNCGTQYQFQNTDQYKRFIVNPNCCASPNWTVV